MPLSAGKVRFAWGAVVGPALERATEVRLDGRVLVVEAESAQWVREVTRFSDTILPRLRTLLGAAVLDRIDVRPANVPR